jgi:flavin reductase (DIM6/NTAB) family NADH-FMN oxidoreductase RutF
VAGGDELRAVMRRFPEGVAVVTVALEDDRLGLTVGSLLSLSLEPPLVGFAVRRDAALHELLREAGGFGVSLLAGDQAEVAAHFARGAPPIVHWHGIDVREGSDPPQLEGALGWLTCGLAAEHRTGDHTFFVGDVLLAEPGQGERGLVWVDGRYVPA